MFDRSLLPDALFEFVVISDTHSYYRISESIIPSREGEFQFSRRLQAGRVETALQLVESLDPSLVIHLGDLINEYPEREEFAQAMSEALQQMERYRVELRLVAGNHDVGDKPDPTTMPFLPVQPETLAWYHARFGQSWYSFDHTGCHFVVLNAQLMNSTLSEAVAQREWLEGDLVSHSGDRIFVFLHMPPYLWDEHEPALGHYDILDEPARGWLLSLVRRYEVEMLVAGHVHFAFFDRIGRTRYLTTTSPSFTRAGFCYALNDCPPERGRNDTPKMGFCLFRVCQHRTDVHFIRTYGAVEIPDGGPESPKRLVTRTSAVIENSPLGVTLRHPLAPSAERPIAWPAVVRRRVRNDYPLLACVELGVKWIRVPFTDLEDSLQSRRLAILRDEGVQITATSFWADTFDLPSALNRHHEQVDGWEVQVLGTPWPSGDSLQVCKKSRAEFRVPIALSTIVREQVVEGKLFPRRRLGYRLEELEELNRHLAQRDAWIDRVLCRVGVCANPWEVVENIRRLSPLSHIGAVDCAFELQLDDQENANRVAEALVGMALLPGSRVYFEPLVDVDRMIDVNHGLLDSMCNPRPAFHVLRCLNSILYSFSEEIPSFESAGTPTANARIRTLVSPDMALSLLLPKGAVRDMQPANGQHMLPDTLGDAKVTVYRLHEGTSAIMTLAQARRLMESSELLGPTLVVRRET
jgi:hypothetical protein